jgi:ABC-type transport system involved in multi-copper enzyme maturation permease subunit
MRQAVKVLAIALNTFREAVRDRVLYNLVAFVLLLILAALVFSQASLGQQARFITDAGLSALRLFGLAIAIFLGVGLVYKEIDKRTVAVLLAKPIERYQFILGKYCGLGLTLLVNTAVMTGAMTLALFSAQQRLDVLQWRIWPAAYLLLLELLVLTALTLLFSSFSTPLLSALFVVLLFLVGNWGSDLKLIAETSPSLVTRALCRLLYYLVPNLPNFNYIAPTANGQMLPARLLIGATAYAALYISAVLAATVLIFQRRDFK